MPKLSDICIDRGQQLVIRVQGDKSQHSTEQDLWNMYSYGQVLAILKGWDGVIEVGFLDKDWSSSGPLTNDLAALWWQENNGDIDDLSFLEGDVPPFVSEHEDIDDWVAEARQHRREFAAERAA